MAEHIANVEQTGSSAQPRAAQEASAGELVKQLSEQISALITGTALLAASGAAALLGKGRLRQANSQAAAVAGKLSEAPPEPVQGAAAKAAAAARERRVQLIMIACAVMLAGVAIARRRQR
jgi:hypothetical protein